MNFIKSGLLELAKKWKADTNGGTYLCGCELESFAERYDVKVRDDMVRIATAAYIDVLKRSNFLADTDVKVRAAIEAVIPEDWAQDKERLDYLERHPLLSEIHANGRVENCCFYGVAGAEGLTLRQIIDAAAKDEERKNG